MQLQQSILARLIRLFVVRMSLPPTAMLSQVTTPRTTNPGAVTLTFSESVFGVDLSSNPTNFALTYDDDGSAGPNVPQVVALNAVAVQQITASEYVLDLTTVLDFTGLTDPGEYSLTFDGTATTIFDFSANAVYWNPTIDHMGDSAGHDASVSRYRRH